MMSRVTDLLTLLGVEHPLMQAGMGRGLGTYTTPQLVAAVSEAGGIGAFGATGLDPEELDSQLEVVRGLTDKPVALNTILPTDFEGIPTARAAARRVLATEHPEHLRFVEDILRENGVELVPAPRKNVVSRETVSEQIEVALGRGVSVFVLALGVEPRIVERLHGEEAVVIATAGAGRHVPALVEAGVDALIAQGTEAGGHVGRLATTTVLREVVSRSGGLPVLAAGGIVDGKTGAGMVVAGASGLVCGTAFLFSDEVDLAPAQREALSAGRSDELKVSKTYTGKTVRTLPNQVMERWERSGLATLPMPLHYALMDDLVWSATCADRFDLVMNPMGEAGGDLREQRPAAGIVADIVTEMRAALDEAPALAW